MCFDINWVHPNEEISVKNKQPLNNCNSARNTKHHSTFTSFPYASSFAYRVHICPQLPRNTGWCSTNKQIYVVTIYV